MQDNRNGLVSYPPPVSRDRVMWEFPKHTHLRHTPCVLSEMNNKEKDCHDMWYIYVPVPLRLDYYDFHDHFTFHPHQCYTPEASLQLKKDWDAQAKAACKDRAVRHQPWDRQRMSKVVVVGDLNVGKTCLINRFCKDVFERDYKATIGVDFEIERFEISGVPFSLQIWDTAGQEKFKCIASAYYRGAQVIITAFDMADIKSLDHTRQWLEEAMRDNEPDSCFVFLVGTKNDLLPSDERQRTEKDAIRIATEMHAEFWAVSAKTGENVQSFFFRVAALAFEKCMLKDMEDGAPASIGQGAVIKSDRANLEMASAQDTKRSCC